MSQAWCNLQAALKVFGEVQSVPPNKRVVKEKRVYICKHTNGGKPKVEMSFSSVLVRNLCFRVGTAMPCTIIMLNFVCLFNPECGGTSFGIYHSCSLSTF